MKTVIRTFGLLAVSAGCLTFASCSKSVDVKSSASTPVISATTQKTSQLDAVNGVYEADMFDNDINDLVMGTDESASGSATMGFGSKPIRTYTPSQTAYPHTLTVDYGTGYTDKFGMVRSGKVIMYYTAATSTSGSVVTTTFDNYVVNGAQISGKSIVSNVTCAHDSYMIFNHLSQRTTNYANGDFRKIITAKVYFQVSSAANTTANNKENFISGTTIGTDFTNGTTSATDAVSGVQTYWVSKVDDRNLLHKLQSCHDVDAGVLNALVYPLHCSTPILESLNYGDGTCDASGVLTYNGKTETVALPLNLWPIN